MIDILDIKKSILDKELEFYIGGDKVYCRADNNDTIQILDLAEHDQQIRDEVIEEVTEKYFDVIEEILHERDLRIELNQALTIYARIMNCCNKIAEQMKGEQNERNQGSKK